MAVRFANNASATLAVGISSTSTSITVLAGEGVLFPTLTGGDIFYATLVNSSNSFEIVRVTARSSDTLTVVRGQEGTAPRTFASGDKIELRVTAAGMESKYDTTGGTLTGDVTVNKANPVLRLTKTNAGQSAALVGTLNDALRWGVTPGDASAESGNNAGSNFTVSRYSDDGTLIDTPITINRATGVAAFNTIPVAPAANPTTDNQLARKAYVDAGVAGANANANGRAPQGAFGASGLTMSASRLLGRTTAGTGTAEEISVGSGLNLSGGTLTANSPPQLRSQLFTGSGSWTAPAGVTQVRVTVIGAGGGGGGWGSAYDTADGQPGASGGVSVGTVAVTPGAAYSITVGGGGSGGSPGGIGGTGAAGGTSSFAGVVTATGGDGGRGGNNDGPINHGSGFGGNLRNTNIASVTPLWFDGAYMRVSGQGGEGWGPSSAFRPGAVGGGGNGHSHQPGHGGVAGIVYVEWAG